MSVSTLPSPCQSCGILQARMRADLNVYLETVVGPELPARKALQSSQSRVERARLAYRTARHRLIQHVDAHELVQAS